jgi:hypothetical protein
MGRAFDGRSVATGLLRAPDGGALGVAAFAGEGFAFFGAAFAFFGAGFAAFFGKGFAFLGVGFAFPGFDLALVTISRLPPAAVFRGSRSFRIVENAGGSAPVQEGWPGGPVEKMHPEAQALVARLALAPHPEGGFYRETWRSPARVITPRGERAALTVIHYLLPAGAFSAFHRVHSDEVWQHVGGGPLEIHVVDPSGAHEVQRVGREGTGVVVPHVVVPAGSWQAARPAGRHHVLACCMVAPGFEFADFEMAREADLMRLRPDLARVFRELCRPPT